MSPGLARKVLPFAPLAVCALASFGTASPILALAGIAMVSNAHGTAAGIATNLAADHFASGWTSCCRRLFDSNSISKEPLNDAMCAAYLSAIDRLDREVWPQAKPSALRSLLGNRSISDPDAAAFFQRLKQDARLAFGDIESQRDDILSTLEQGPQFSNQLVDDYLQNTVAPYPTLQGPFLDLVTKKLTATVKQEFDQRIWNNDEQGTAVWREYLELIIREMSAAQVITAQQQAEAIAALPDLITKRLTLAQEERDRQFDATLGLLENRLDNLPGEIATTVVASVGPALEALLSSQSTAPPDTARVPSHRSNIPHRPSRYFVGRDAELDEIRRRFAEESGPVALVQAIQGLGGVGKTQLAVHFAHRFSSDYAGIWWIRAETPETLVNDYVALARELGLAIGESASQEDTIAAVRQYLGNTQETGERWLLIFDNADPNQAALASTIPSRGRCDVLITSRIRDWSGLYQEQNVGVLPKEDTIRFFKDRTGESDDDAAGNLAEALGRLPLALEQAAAYVVAHRPQETLAKYLERFNRKPLDRLYEDKPRTGEYDEVVATTWMISFEVVEAEEPAAGDFLRLCAFLAPEQIPLELILSQVDQMPKRLSEAVSDPDRSPNVIAALLRYSLVEPAGSSAIDVHRLVQLVVREWLTAAERETWAAATVRVINAIFPDGAHEAATWSLADSLLAHGLAAANYAEALHVEEAISGQLLNRIGRYLFGHGQYTPAVNAFERALALRMESLGSNHVDVAMDMNDLGMALEKLSKPDEAQPLHERSLAIDEAAYGPDHPSVAIGLNNLASLRQAQGKLDEAHPLYERSLAISEAVNGPNHPEVAATLSNFAKLRQAQGKLDEAQSLYERALSICEAAYGADHPDVATILRNLANLRQAQGKLGDARILYERAINSAVRVGADSNAAITSRAFARFELEQGRITPALTRLKAALEFDQRAGNRQGEALDFHEFALVAQAVGSRSDVGRLLILRWKILDDIGDADAPRARLVAERSLPPAHRSGFDQKAVAIAGSYERDKGRKIIDDVFRNRK